MFEIHTSPLLMYSDVRDELVCLRYTHLHWIILIAIQASGTSVKRWDFLTCLLFTAMRIGHTTSAFVGGCLSLTSTPYRGVSYADNQVFHH